MAQNYYTHAITFIFGQRELNIANLVRSLKDERNNTKEKNIEKKLDYFKCTQRMLTNLAK
jgi:hypothetical protein